MSLIKLENLWFRYKDRWIIKGVDLDIKEYKVYCLVGPNGCGKTTLAKLICGLLKPQRGNVFVKGVNTKEVSVKEIVKHVGYIFQNPDSQFFLNKVKDEIEFAQKMLNKYLDKNTYNYFLRILGIDKLLDKSPFNLSVGEKMRVAIMSVLAYDPEIIIFDEPTLGADGDTYKKILHIIKQLKERKRCIILISHDINLIDSIADYVIPMKDGRVFGIIRKNEFFGILDDIYELESHILLRTSGKWVS